jgi:hypothetical protein
MLDGKFIWYWLKLNSFWKLNRIFVESIYMVLLLLLLVYYWSFGKWNIDLVLILLVITLISNWYMRMIAQVICYLDYCFKLVLNFTTTSIVRYYCIILWKGLVWCLWKHVSNLWQQQARILLMNCLCHFDSIVWGSLVDKFCCLEYDWVVQHVTEIVEVNQVESWMDMFLRLLKYYWLESSPFYCQLICRVNFIWCCHSGLRWIISLWHIWDNTICWKPSLDLAALVVKEILTKALCGFC